MTLARFLSRLRPLPACAVLAALCVPAGAIAAASPADASSPVTDNAPPHEVHYVAGALLTGTVASNDTGVANPDGTTASGNLGSRIQAYAGAEFPLTANGLRLRLTAGVHVGNLTDSNGVRERFTRYPLEATLMLPMNDKVRLGAGIRYPMHMTFGGAGRNSADGLNATPSVLATFEYKLVDHLWLTGRYVVERYEPTGGGSLSADHWGIGAMAMY